MEQANWIDYFKQYKLESKKGEQMKKDKTIDELEQLAQADIDAVHTYDRVLDEINDDIIRSRLDEFRKQHVDHIVALSEEIRSMGGQPPELTKDFKGYAIEAFAAIGAAVGMKSALKALEAAERITLSYYDEMVSSKVSPSMKDLLRKHFTDEKIHLEYLENNLKAL